MARCKLTGFESAIRVDTSYPGPTSADSFLVVKQSTLAGNSTAIRGSVTAAVSISGLQARILGNLIMQNGSGIRFDAGCGACVRAVVVAEVTGNTIVDNAGAGLF